MKTFRKFLYVALSILILGCQDDEANFGDILVPTNFEIAVDVASDQSGNVSITPSAEDVLNFQVFFQEDVEPVIVSESGGTAQFRYTQSGIYTQIMQVVAYGTGGASSTKSITVDLDVRLVIPQNILENIAGMGEKRWIWDATNAGHFGVGDPAETFPNFFSAAPNQLNPCMYDDVLVFKYDDNDNYTFTLETAEATFINWADVKRFFPDATPNEFEDECRNINDQLALNTNFVIIENAGLTTLTVDNSTLSYWSGAMSYEIVTLIESKLVVRGIQEPFDPVGNSLAWYHTFIPEDNGVISDCDSGSTGNAGSGNNDVLVWADEFNEDGAPCSENWVYDIGTGDNGWGNGESQFYTDRPENIIVENGVLKIKAIAETFNGSNYTSARINSKNRFEFSYGRIETRAKLPTGAGTWPAIWSLGADIDTNPWPGAGEIDFMEHVGNNQDRIYSTVHYPGNSGGNAVGNSVVVPGVSDEFHIYEVTWDENQIVASVDGTVFFTFDNNASLPFNKDFFLLMNVAMGGSFGGAIDPNFQSSTMEVDYIRVYQ